MKKVDSRTPKTAATKIPRTGSFSKRAGVSAPTVSSLARKSKALTLPETLSVVEVCKRLSLQKQEAVLLTRAGSLSGIMTDKDLCTRVIARGLDPQSMPVSEVMTKNPAVTSTDAQPIDALRTMLEGRFRHLPVVQGSGTVVGILDVAKLLGFAIESLKGSAAKADATVKNWASFVEKTPSTQVERSQALLESLVRPTVQSEVYTNFPCCSPADTIDTAVRTMVSHAQCAILVAHQGALHGIMTSRDVLTRVVAKERSASDTLVGEVMTKEPKCVSTKTTLLDALHMMHTGGFRHLPVVDDLESGMAITGLLDVLSLTHKAIGLMDQDKEHLKTFIQSLFADQTPDDELASDACSGFEDVSRASRASSEVVEEMTSDPAPYAPTQSDENIVSAGESGRASPTAEPISFVFKFKDDGPAQRFRLKCSSVDQIEYQVRKRLKDCPSSTQLSFRYMDTEHEECEICSMDDVFEAWRCHQAMNFTAVHLILKRSDRPDVPSSAPVGSQPASAFSMGQNSLTAASQRPGVNTMLAGAAVVGLAMLSALARGTK